MYVFGGHGQRDHLECDGARNYACWNGITVDGPLATERITQAVFAEMEDDILGPGVRAKLRQMVTRKATEAWNANQKLQPGPKSPAEFDRFRQSIEDGTVAAVRAYARMKLVNPVELQVDIAGSKVNPPQT